MPTCWIIAGPNGAGKTTFALSYLPEVAHCRNFINADLIAAGLSPLAPEQSAIAASRLFLKEIQTNILRRQDFAFETTLSGRGHLKMVRDLRAQNWQIKLIYLALLNSQLAVQRVAERVAHGGHDIPKEDIQRRFPRSLRNLLDHYSPAVDQALCYLNVGNTPTLIFEEHNGSRVVANQSLFEQLMEKSRL